MGLGPDPGVGTGELSGGAIGGLVGTAAIEG